MSQTQIVQDVRTSLARTVDAHNAIINGDHPDRDAQRAQLLVHVAPHTLTPQQHTAASLAQGQPWDTVA